jgi:hypothetical protein
MMLYDLSFEPKAPGEDYALSYLEADSGAA